MFIAILILLGATAFGMEMGSQGGHQRPTDRSLFNSKQE